MSKEGWQTTCDQLVPDARRLAGPHRDLRSGLVGGEAAPRGRLIKPTDAILVASTRRQRRVNDRFDPCQLRRLPRRRPDHVKVPYFPNWRRRGASGPYPKPPRTSWSSSHRPPVVLSLRTTKVDWPARRHRSSGVGAVALFRTPSRHRHTPPAPRPRESVEPEPLPPEVPRGGRCTTRDAVLQTQTPGRREFG